MDIKITKEEHRQAAIKHLQGLKLGLDAKKRRRTYDYRCVKRDFKRSLKQNRLLWLWLGCIYESTGNETRDLYLHYLDLFAPSEEYKTPLGDIKYRQKTSSQFTEPEMTLFLKRIDHDVSTEGIKLLYPEDQYFEMFYDSYKKYIR